MTRAAIAGLAVDPGSGDSIPYKHNIFGFMTIDTPHKGSSSRWQMRFLSGASKDMVSGSGFLQQLNAASAPVEMGTCCSVAVGNAMGEPRGDGLFSVDEQIPAQGTVPSSTVVRAFPVVHGAGIWGVDYSKYTAALESPEVRKWASIRYSQALREYRRPDGRRSSHRPARPSSSGPTQ